MTAHCVIGEPVTTDVRRRRPVSTVTIAPTREQCRSARSAALFSRRKPRLYRNRASHRKPRTVRSPPNFRRLFGRSFSAEVCAALQPPRTELNIATLEYGRPTASQPPPISLAGRRPDIYTTAASAPQRYQLQCDTQDTPPQSTSNTMPLRPALRCPALPPDFASRLIDLDDVVAYNIYCVFIKIHSAKTNV